MIDVPLCEELLSGSEDGEDVDKEREEIKESTGTKAAGRDDDTIGTADQAEVHSPYTNEKPVTSEEYLKSELTYDDKKLLGSDLNGVMMAWGMDIMERTVAAYIPDDAADKRILNIGFGMGIVDGMFAERNPARHHIIEAHPSVLEHIAKPDSRFGPMWEKSGSKPGAFKVHAGK